MQLAFCDPSEVSVILVLSNGVIAMFSSEDSVDKFMEILDLEGSDLEVQKRFTEAVEVEAEGEDF